MKRNLTILLTVMMILLSSCSGLNINIKSTEEPVSTPTATLELVTPQPTPTAEPTPSPTAVPTQPKYIFIVIGDGFGRGAMMMGEIYARLQSEDMAQGAVWEGFTQQKWVDGRGESASGGTAIATGYVTPPSFISQNTEYQDLVTIMDRAKEAGMSTGVVTNSFLLDATPATFLTHDDWRLNFDDLAERMWTSNVDYIAGGGLMRLVPKSYYSSFDSLDCRNSKTQDVSDVSQKSAFPKMVEEMGYVPYLGLTGAQSFLSQVDAGTFSDTKAICVFSESTMTYETSKMDPENAERYKYVPKLEDMVSGGIQSLSQNPNGFVMMIEEGLIDKRGHNGSQYGNISQIRVLNDTLKTIMDFYNEHPYETLVVLTADHETGEYKYNEERFAEFKTFPSFAWSDNPNEVIDFLDSVWGVEVYGSKITKYVNYGIEKPWNDIKLDRASLYNYVTLQTSLDLGIEPKTEYHSWQLVPCYSIGVGSQEMERTTGIQDIPIIICEIMGWNALPEVAAK
ncbi:MAG: alkaline phosphatase [Eubacteriales bacterium]